MIVFIYLLISIAYVKDVLSEIYNSNSLNRIDIYKRALNIDDFKILPIKVTYNLTYQTILTLSNPNENVISSHQI